VLANEAREILRTVGYSAPPGDSTFGLEYDVEYIDYIGTTSAGPRRWDRLDSRAIFLWYRQSPRPLEHRSFALLAQIGPADPPLQYSGDALVLVDSQGRLRRLEVLAPQAIPGNAAGREVDWSLLFTAAGLDIARWQAIESRWNPLHYSDARASWEGTLPPFDVPARIEAAAYRGVPVWFDVVLPTAQPSREPGSAASAPTAPRSDRRSGAVPVLLVVLFTIGAAFLARRNLRMGRGDRRGAARLVIVNAIVGAVAWTLREHHVGTIQELLYLVHNASHLLFTSSLLWLGYVALEPFVRRQWPQMLVSWARLLAGDWRDPLVGRDILIGCTGGALVSCFGQMEYFAPVLLGLAEPMLATPVVAGMTGPLAFLERVIGSAFFVSVFIPMIWLFFLCALRMLLRNTWLAGAVAALLLAPMLSSRLLFAAEPWAILPVALIGNILLLAVLIRVGFLAVAVVGYVITTLNAFPLTFEASAWYAGFGYAALAIVAALALFGFKTALGGRRVFELADG
jgi:serine/threonine-protein kinase